MKKYVKVLCLVLTAVLLVGAMSGCGEKDDGTTRLSVSNWPNPEANPKGYETYQTRKADFEAANANIIIEPEEWVYDVKTYLAKAEGGTLPDLYYTPFTEFNKIIDGGYAIDIKDKLIENGWYDQISEDMLKVIEKDGEVYFIPKSSYTIGLVFNLDLLEKAGLVEEDGTPMAPKTLDELVDVARQVTEKTGKAGFIFPTTNNQGGWYFTMLAWNYGVEFVKKDKNGDWKAAFNTDDCVKALQYIKDLKWKYDVLPANTLVDANEITKQIGSGMAGMSFMAPSSLNNMIKNYGMSKDSIGFSYVPAGPKKHVTLMGGSCVTFANTATEKEVDAGFKWLVMENITPELTDAYKQKQTDKILQDIEENELVGVIDTAVWNEKSETFSFLSQLSKEKCNVNYNHIRLFNENKVDAHTEVEVCAQELYALLDACIQEVLTNKDADCKALIKKAADDYQRNFLDYEN